MEALQNAGWIDVDHTEEEFSLSPKGFELGNQRHQTKTQQESNLFLVVFTAALVLISLTETLATAPVASPVDESMIRILGAVIVAVILGFVLWWTKR